MLPMILIASVAAPEDRRRDSVVRATLENGLRVVIVRDPLAPVVTVEENYLAGGNETPSGFPGMAHAQEHMAFRGCAGLSADQIAAIYAQLGGSQNADTQQTITQYFVTVPAQDLEVALRRMTPWPPAGGDSALADPANPRPCAADEPDDRRSAVGQRRQLGLVLRSVAGSIIRSKRETQP